MADQGGLQLLPETRHKVEVRREGENKMLVWGVIVLILVVGGFVGANFYLTTLEEDLGVLDNQYMGIENQRDKDAEIQITTLNKQLSLINNLLDNHVFWSNGFNKFEQLTLPSLRFKSLTGSSDAEKIDFKVTTRTYTDIAKQIAAYLTDESIIDVNINGTSALPNGQIDTDLSINFDSINFLRK